jgi:hypothetical protein
MPEKRAETLVAENGTTEDMSRRLENIARMSDRLIGTFGRLAVKDALTEVPPGEATLQEPPAPAPRLAIPMGKPLQLVKDEFYFIARCPVTGDILDAIHDDAGGMGGPLAGQWRVTCADCNTAHVVDLAKMEPEQFKLAPPAENPDGWPD